MTQIDEKDRKILRALFENARASFSQIGKKARLSKEVVHYRVKRLLEQEFLLGFNTVIDVKKLGWQIYFVYIQLKNIDEEKEKELINHLCTHPNVAWVVKCIGEYDLLIKIFVRSYPEMGQVMKRIELEYKQVIDRYAINYGVEEIPVPATFLYGAAGGEIYPLLTEQKENVPLSDINRKILAVIAKNARLQTIQIAKEVNEPWETVKYHLKMLEKQEIILKYRPSIWKGTKDLGYQWCFITLQVGYLSKELEKRLFQYVVTHPNVTYLYKTSGSSEMQIEIKIKTTDELNQILMEVRGILKGALKRHELLLILHEYKYTYFPECLQLKKN
ncbi:Lrp/AsnC family transcriptional regulator [Candidatus Woesearchaeota archaeon]|nr:Lrp/AsnC family transcriptional regulator [Candidatus Woesearchaeota archaeon]